MPVQGSAVGSSAPGSARPPYVASRSPRVPVPCRPPGLSRAGAGLGRTPAVTLMGRALPCAPLPATPTAARPRSLRAVGGIGPAGAPVRPQLGEWARHGCCFASTAKLLAFLGGKALLERSQILQPRMLLYSERGRRSQLLLPSAQAVPVAKAMSWTGSDGGLYSSSASSLSAVAPPARMGLPLASTRLEQGSGTESQLPLGVA